MLIIFLGVIILIVGIVFLIIERIYYNNNGKYNDRIAFIGLILLVVGIVWNVVFDTTAICSNAYFNINKELCNQEYSALIHKIEVYETTSPDRLHVYSYSDLINEIKEWNTNYLREKYYSENIWTNWLNPFTYEDTSLIDFEILEVKE